LLLGQAVFGRSVYRVLLLVPWAFPVIVTAYVWRWLLNDQGGFVTWLAMTSGIIQQPVAWLAEANTALPAVVSVAVWAGYPFMLAAMLAGLQSIPVEYHEVAQIEGASVFQELFSVTLPLLRPIIVIVLVLRTIWTFNAFDLIYLLTNGGPDGQTLTLPILAYNLGWQQYLPGKAAAMSMLMLLVLAIAGVIYFRVSGWARKEGQNG
jgi:multiple sugar transport system permease protein